MKLYIVVYIAGLIGGTVGPLPYGPDECARRVAEQHAALNRDLTTPQGFTWRDIRFECEWHAVRPDNHPSAGKQKGN